MKYCHRFLETVIKESLAAEKIVILLGARQTGKSTLLNMLLPESSLKSNLQNTRQRLEFSKTPHLLSEVVHARTEDKVYVFINANQRREGTEARQHR